MALALASRTWRSSGIPWGVVPLSVAVTGGWGLSLVFILVLIMLSTEVAGRPGRWLEALLASTVPLIFWTPAVPDLSPGLIRLTMVFALTLVVVEGIGFAVPSLRTFSWNPWTEIAASFLLLASATLLFTGLNLNLPILAVLGLSAPAMLPALFRETRENRLSQLRLRSFADFSELSGLFRPASGAPTLKEITQQLHQVLEPVLHHDLTVIAMNPAVRLTQCIFAAHPLPGKEQERVQERARYLFQSGRCMNMREARRTSSKETLHLYPQCAHQLLIPIYKDRQTVALVAFLADFPLLADHDVPLFTESVNAILLGIFAAIEEQQRLSFLSQRTEQEGRRLRYLLELNQLIATSPDLRTLANNLVRTVCISFGFTWTGFLLRLNHGERFKLVAWSGETEGWQEEGRSNIEISADALRETLDLGSILSQCHVLPLERWPLPIPNPPGTDHLLAIPVEQAEQTVGHVLLLPHALYPMPDLEDLRALEILVEQVAPVIASGLHLEEVSRKTLQDSLTGVANRRSLDEKFKKTIERARKSGEQISFAMLDIDDFKLVNDRYGHRIGDVVLVEIAGILLKNVRSNDFVARYGGEEFSVVLPGLSAERARDVLERLRQSLAAYEFAADELPTPLKITISIGLATFPHDGTEVNTVMEAADMALYRAKRRGKNRVIAAWEVTSESPPGLDEPFAL